MRLDAIQDLLDLIVSYDRSPFGDRADQAWAAALDGVEYPDARQAVIEHYTSLGARDSRGEVRRVLPADVKSRALAIRDNRLRATARTRAELPAAPRGLAARSPEAAAELRAALQRASAAGERYRARLHGQSVAA
jgi:hypothetical protein